MNQLGTVAVGSHLVRPFVFAYRLQGGPDTQDVLVHLTSSSFLAVDLCEIRTMSRYEKHLKHQDGQLYHEHASSSIRYHKVPASANDGSGECGRGCIGAYQDLLRIRTPLRALSACKNSTRVVVAQSGMPDLVLV